MFLFVLLFLFYGVSAQFEHFFTMDQNGDYISRMNLQLQTLQKRVEKLEAQMAGLQQKAHADWNQTDSGSMYKLFPERKTWEAAEKFCTSLDAHLVTVDSEQKNKFIVSLLNESPTVDFAWIGMKTKASTRGFSEHFSNFNEDSPIDGCAVIDATGVWSIRSCTQLRPFVCQMVIAV